MCVRADQQFEWSESQQSSFEDLKSALIGNEVVAYLNDKGLLILDVDMSDLGIGEQFCKVSETDQMAR